MSWGFRVKTAEYDGDILLLPQQSWAFAVTWQNGVLYINRQSEKVAWSSVRLFQELPLLPYEKQLIKTIGCSEEEYRYFVAEAIKRGADQACCL